MSIEWLIGFFWFVSLAIGFISRMRARFSQEAYVFIGLTIGGAIFFALDYRSGICGGGLLLIFCSSEASVVWGIAVGALLAKITIFLRKSLGADK